MPEFSLPASRTDASPRGGAPVFVQMAPPIEPLMTGRFSPVGATHIPHMRDWLSPADEGTPPGAQREGARLLDRPSALAQAAMPRPAPPRGTLPAVGKEARSPIPLRQPKTKASAKPSNPAGPWSRFFRRVGLCLLTIFTALLIAALGKASASRT